VGVCVCVCGGCEVGKNLTVAICVLRGSQKRKRGKKSLGEKDYPYLLRSANFFTKTFFKRANSPPISSPTTNSPPPPPPSPYYPSSPFPSPSFLPFPLSVLPVLTLPRSLEVMWSSATLRTSPPLKPNPLYTTGGSESKLNSPD